MFLLHPSSSEQGCSNRLSLGSHHSEQGPTFPALTFRCYLSFRQMATWLLQLTHTKALKQNTGFNCCSEESSKAMVLIFDCEELVLKTHVCSRSWLWSSPKEILGDVCILPWRCICQNEFYSILNLKWINKETMSGPHPLRTWCWAWKTRTDLQAEQGQHRLNPKFQS